MSGHRRRVDHFELASCEQAQGITHGHAVVRVVNGHTRFFKACAPQNVCPVMIASTPKAKTSSATAPAQLTSALSALDEAVHSPVSGSAITSHTAREA